MTLIAADGSAVTGTGEVGARVEVRGPDNALLGTGIVAGDGSYTVALVPAQVAGEALSVTQADRAGNVSGSTGIVAPFDIIAFDNVDTAAIDFTPTTTPVSLGSTGSLLLLSLDVIDLQADLLTLNPVRFNVDNGHSLDAVFAAGGVANIGVAGNYAVVVQRLEGSQWVAVSGTGEASLLSIGVLNGGFGATQTLDPGEYRAFLAVQGVGGIGLLGSLSVSGVDADFTDIAGVTPIASSGNVITDAGASGELDITAPGTRVASVSVAGIPTLVSAGGSIVAGQWGSLSINPDGSYTYTPNADAGAVGRTDVFTYTLIDPSDGELASATLSISIGSPDITGAPIAVADQVVADVTFQNVVTVSPPTQAFSFSATTTGSGGSNFTVAPDATTDVTIIANRLPGLGISVLPQYTVTIRDGSGAAVRTASALAAADGLLGGTVTFTFDDLPTGNYSYSVSSAAVSLGSFTTSVSFGSTTTFLNDFTLASRETVTGNLLDNDSANTAFAAIRVNAGAGFADIGDTPVTLTGQHGTLTIDETGGYSYQPSASLGFSAVDLFDTFTYQLVQPNGVLASATLTVTIDVPGDGPAPAATVEPAVQQLSLDADVIPLDALALHAGESVAVTPPDAAISRAAYDLFEGKGELEDVLSHYLAVQQEETPLGIPETVHPAMVESAAMPAIVDPFDYIATMPDQDHNGTASNHVV